MSKPTNRKKILAHAKSDVITDLPLLSPRSRLALISNHWMQLQLDRVLRSVPAKTLTPVIADRVREDIAVPRESSSGDRASDLRITFETMLGILIPEVEGTVATGGAECAVLGMEGDSIYGVDFRDVPLGGILLAMAFE